jgi:alginate O-acetyltransferase complex protein AlgI
LEFTSLHFAVFLIAVFAVHWAVARVGAWAQNAVLLITSALFYALADPRFLALLVVSAAITYGVGVAQTSALSEVRKRLFYWVGISASLGMLCYFKYLGFFYEGTVHLLNHIGLGLAPHVLHLALPLGISFFTFSMLGYLIAVRNEDMEPCKDPLHFLTYVLYFPKIMAGPIEPAIRFLPRLSAPRTFDASMATDGLRRILWGLVAKVVIADNASAFVDIIFRDPGTASGSTLLVGALLYFAQIYCDFSGYSNMAIGASQLLGLPLMNNFSTPWFATSINEFWRRWHMSLTSWMIDHLFTPLSFLLRERGKWGTLLAISVTFLAVGIWHGAAWTFVVFGLLQSVYFVPLALKGSLGRSAVAAPTTIWPGFLHLTRMAGMFLLMALSFVLLRAQDLSQAVTYYQGLLSPSLFSLPRVLPSTVALLLAGFVLVEWIQRARPHALDLSSRCAMPLRWGIYAALFFLVVFLNRSGSYQFIYFQY